MLRLRYFASVREAVGRDQQQLELPADVTTVADLIRHLSFVDADFERMINGPEQVLIAVNETVANRGKDISDGDEVAFFPPMSGG